MGDDAKEETLALFLHLRNSVSDVLPEQPQVRDRIALLALRHATLGVPSRALILGPPEIDASAIMASVAEALDTRHLRIPLGMISGHGWREAGLAEWLKDLGPAVSSNAVVTLTDFESLRVERGRYAGLSASSQRFADDVARSVAQLLAGEPLRLEAGPAIRTRGLLVAVSGEGRGLQSMEMAELIDWGVPRPVATHLARASHITIEPPSEAALVLLLIDALADISLFFRSLGFKISITPETLRYAIRSASSGDRGGLHAAAAWIRTAAEERLIEILQDDLFVEQINISPDSLRIPTAAPPTRWRE